MGLRMLLLLFLAATLWGGNNPLSQKEFSPLSGERTLRIDLYHTGTADQERYTIARLYERPGWAGPELNDFPLANLGMYLLEVLDTTAAQRWYAQGYSTLFNEWQTTARARAGQWKTFQETVRIPFPEKPFRLRIWRRDARNAFTRLVFDQKIDPSRWNIHTEPTEPEVQHTVLQQTGPASRRVDVVFLAEGYVANQQRKFEQDARRMMEALFAVEPFRSHREAFNCYAAFVASRQEGVDEPDKTRYRATALGASFGTFGLPRYLMSEAVHTLHNVAEKVPYDAIVILVNTDRYGGGGIYQLYACTTVDNRWSSYVMVHEFGHSFAGLGDEYYSSTVAYEEFYPPGVEPWEPNLTALLNPAQLKWRHLVAPDTPLPTPWDKELYEQKTSEYQQQRKKLQQEGASAQRLAELEDQFQRWLQDFFARQKYAGKVGAFEGAGYVAKGLYRPAVNCIMFSKGLQDFDPVCREAIVRVIRAYTGGPSTR